MTSSVQADSASVMAAMRGSVRFIFYKGLNVSIILKWNKKGCKKRVFLFFAAKIQRNFEVCKFFPIFCMELSQSADPRIDAEALANETIFRA